MKLRKLMIAVAAICILGLGALAIWIMQLDAKDVAALVERKVEQATGRKLRIEGPIALKFSLIPTVAIEGVHFQNASWGSKPDMLSVKRAEVQLALLPLLHGEVALRKIDLIEPQVLLEVNAKGEGNWVFNAQDKTEDPQHKLTINIAELRIERGALTYRPAAPAQAQMISIDTLSLQSSGGAQATIDMKFALNKIAIELAGVIPNPTRLGTARAPLDLKIVCGDARFTLSGQIPAQTQSTQGGLPMEGAELRFSAQADNPAALARQFQVTLPRLPKLLLEGQAHVVKSVLELTIDKAQLGGSSARAQLHMPLQSARRTLSVNVDSPLVDLREILGPFEPVAKTKTASSGGRLFSDEPLPLKNFAAFDVRADIKVARLVLRDGRALQSFASKFDLQHGKLLADPVSVSVEGKPLRARVQADVGSGQSLTVDATLNGKGIALASLAALANVAAVPEGAPTDLAIHFNGHGASVRQIMASSNANVQMVVGPGRWKGHAFDMSADITQLVTVLAPASKTGDYTELQCAVLRFPVTQGVAHIDNGIGVELTKVKVLVSGTVDLRDETLKLAFRPRAGTGLGVGVGSLAQLVRVGGTLSKPGIEVDPLGTATTAIELGLAATTSGGSLLAQRLFADKSADHPCQSALGTALAVQGQAGKTDKSPGKSQAIDNPAEALKKLFGG